ncbi:NAD(P)H-hydrate dehydratase [Flavobacterium macacae]|uniref:ADP-dependent (S)-NAD(P)H-hydrate dehydratase n=1 Tax=Flavobacterium macacae TaxID=2488993 RepID=A0A3P3WEE4_9FLAO|nr:NAD(P)H-hydrate dehydratase [Flavobacterium macacae]RRJ93515.1 NAD(P)H-hydrate dehydratase [Flavobacterium macacae]
MENLILDLKKILAIYKPLEQKTHKGSQGHALIIGGSYGKIGSIVLASKACLRSGCGLVTALIPKCGYDVLQTALPEAMVLTDDNERCISNIEFEIEPKAIAIGMGMGQEMLTQKAFHQFLKTNNKPLLIDADGINILARNKNLLELLPEKTILTPHKKELERLIGSWKSEEEKLKLIGTLAKKFSLIFVIKGAPTHIFDGENLYKNTTGNPALATAGSGDSLSGIITSFLAQGYKPLEASLFGVYLHGLTADIAISATGYESFIASDISENLGKAFLSLNK